MKFYVGIVGKKGKPYTNDFYKAFIEHKYYSLREKAKHKGIFIGNIAVGSILILAYSDKLIGGDKLIAFGEVIKANCSCNNVPSTIANEVLVQPHAHVEGWRPIKGNIDPNNICAAIGSRKSGIDSAQIGGIRRDVVKEITAAFARQKGIIP
jgi:hypothetical protein